MARIDLTQKPIGFTLWSMTWPAIIGNLSIYAADLADMWFVSQSSDEELMALSVLTPCIIVLNSILLGMGSGISTVVSQNFIKDKDSIQRFTAHTFLYGLILSLAVALCLALGMGLLLDRIIDDATLRGHIRDYLIVYIYGAPLLLIPILATAPLRGMGDTKTPARLMLLVAFLNLFLDPLLIFGYGNIIPAMGIQGAVLATLLARTIPFIFLFRILLQRDMVKITLSGVRYSFHHFFAVGAPITLGKALVPLSAVVITIIVATQGVEAVTAFWIGMRIDKVALVPLIALTYSLTPLIGANWGIGNTKRVLSGWRTASSLAIIWCLFSMAILISYNKQIARLFTNNMRVIEILEDYITIISCSYAGYALISVTIATLNGTNHVGLGFFINIVKNFLCTLPFCFIGSLLLGINGIFFGTCITAWTIAGLSVFYYKKKIVSYELTEREKLRLLYYSSIPDELQLELSKAMFWEHQILKFETFLHKVSATLFHRQRWHP